MGQGMVLIAERWNIHSAGRCAGKKFSYSPAFSPHADRENQSYQKIFLSCQDKHILLLCVPNYNRPTIISILYFNSHRAIQVFTVYQIIYVIKYFTKNKFMFSSNYS